MISDWSRHDAVQWGGARAAQIIDALLDRNIRVTKQMIRDGYKSDCRHCPVALAILAILPGAEVYADYSAIDVDSCVRFSVPENVERFMVRFDYTSNRESMSGICFTLTELQTFYCSPKPSE